MKKFLIIFFLLSATTLYSQTKVTTFKNTFGYYNNYTKQFDLNEYTYAEITFTFYDDYISVNDEAHSIYRIIRYLPKETYREYSITSTKCLDERNRECKVALIRYNDGSFSIDLLYDDKAFIYVVN